MEISQLRAILALKELASFAKAGEQLRLSPSAVFCQIRQLEDEIGQKLYERTGKHLHLTDAGETLAQRASMILRAHDEALRALMETGKQGHRLLRIGCGPHSSVRIAPHLLRAFLAAHPNTEVRLFTSEDQTLLKDLRWGLLDAVMMSLPVEDDELHGEPLWSYEYVFVLPATKWGSKRKLGFAKMRGMPFILYKRPGQVGTALRRICQELAFSPDIVMESDLPDSIKELVKLGLGIALLPRWSVGDDARKGLLRIVRPSKRQYFNYGLVYAGSSCPPTLLTDLLSIARQWRHWWPLAHHVAPPIQGSVPPSQAR